MSTSNGIESRQRVSVVLGAQWGDEGKGKLVDLLAEHADIVARCQVRLGALCSWHDGSGWSSHRLESRKLEPFLDFGGRARRIEPFVKGSSLFRARFSP
jgi:hypothetical protein